MRRLSGSTLGTVAAVLVLLVTVLSLVGVGPALGHLAVRDSPSSAARPVAHVVPVGTPTLISSNGQAIRPAAGPAISYTTKFSLYMTVPFPVSFTTTVPTLTPTQQVAITQEYRIFVPGCGGAGAPCPTVTNNTVCGYPAVAPSGPTCSTAPTASYTTNVTLANITASGYANSQMPQAEYQLITWLSVTNLTGPGSLATVGTSQSIYLIITPPSGKFLSPTANSSLSGGNTTVAVQYSGDWVTGANVSIYSGTTLVYSQGVFSPGPGTHAAAFSWTPAGAGTYRLAISVTTPAGTNTTQENVTVTSTSNVVYLNHSSYQNASVIPGVGPGATAAILLVIGLIVGMLVALALARALWGGTTTVVTPAQPWTGTKPAGYECSVCHQTFATQAELDEHAKTAHGINP
jgi:hypothetical protein